MRARFAVPLRVIAAATCAAVLATAGCKREEAARPAATPASDSATAQGAAATPAGSAATAESKGFDASRLPVSDAALGAFPYLGLPEGYVATDVVQNDFDRVPFWTGDRIEWVEGKVHSAALGAAGDKPFSPLELSRNVQALVESLGGKRIASGPLPAEASQEIGNSKAGVAYVGGLGDIYNEPADTYVIHRADRDIWIHVCAGSNAGGWIIAETRPFQSTAKALPAEALKQALDGNGKVAIEVNFATDAAQILPDSEPQLAQVIALLRADPQLRLAVGGHTDNSGTPTHNQQLSQARADAVVQRLTAAGIAADRLSAQGFGQTQPVADNANEEGRAKNRRVELVKR